MRKQARRSEACQLDELEEYLQPKRSACPAHQLGLLVRLLLLGGHTLVLYVPTGGGDQESRLLKDGSPPIPPAPLKRESQEQWGRGRGGGEAVSHMSNYT